MNSQRRGISNDPGGQRNYIPDASKKRDLQRRLYDQGVSHIPMPSVKRPIEEKTDSRPYSAKMNPQNLSPMKKRIQELNTNMAKNMNESYLGEIPEDQVNFENSMLTRLSPNDLSLISPQQLAATYVPGTMPNAQIPNLHQMNKKKIMHVKGFSQTANSITGVTTMSGLRPYQAGTKGKADTFNSKLLLNKPRPPKEVPPIDQEIKDRINQSLEKNALDQSLFAGPPALVHAGFEGGISISQKNIEHARTRHLLDILTDKVSQEIKPKNLPPLDSITPGPGTGGGRRKSKASIMSGNSPKSTTRRDEDKVKKVGFDETAAEGEKKKPQKWSDLDKYIELLLDSKNDDEAVFVYLNPNENGDPYDLKVCSFQERRSEKYYTLSGKGLTLYESDNPVEFISLGQWLIERDSYNHIKELSFFKKFKRWKFMRMWKKTVKHQARTKAQNALEDKLFILHPIFRTHLMKHRLYCMEMQKLRFVDVSGALSTQTIADFGGSQQKRRKETREMIEDFSHKCRDNINESIQRVLNELRERIVSEIALDEERKKNNPIQSSSTLVMKQKNSHTNYETLGFPEGMTYGHRSSLRKECSRFLRFAYLIDFLSLESLTNVYIGSVKDLIQRLDMLDSFADMEKVMTFSIEEANRNQSGPVRGTEPMFYIKVQLSDDQEIPEDEIKQVQINDFKVPPHGTSVTEDFDMMAHIEVEPEPEEDKEEDGSESEEQDDPEEFMKEDEPIYQVQIPQIEKFWLQLQPGLDDFYQLIINCFNEGLDCIQVFERWSKHDDLTPYSNVLEEWDDMVGDDWTPPDQNTLDPHTWISENPLFPQQKDLVKNILLEAYRKAEMFLTRFREILQIYWRNQKVDLNVLVHERLKNPTDTLSNSIKLFNYLIDLFANELPHTTDIGLLHLDSKDLRETLTPVPKHAIAKIEEIVPVTMRERTDIAKKWLQESIRKLQKVVTNVEEFVEQNTDLNTVNDNFQMNRDNVDLINQYYNILTEYSLKNKKEDKDNFTEVTQLISQLSNLIGNVENSQDANMDTFKKTLDELIPKLNGEIDGLHGEAIDEVFLSGDANMYEVLNKIDSIEVRFKELEERATKYNTWQEVLQTQPTVFENLDQLREDFQLRAVMWRSLKQWEELTEGWAKQKFDSIDAKSIQTQADKFAKICSRVEKNLPDNPIGSKLKDLVDTFKGAMPIVVALRNDALKEHHWAEIKNLIQQDFDVNDEEFTLNSLIELNAVQYQEQISMISTQASQESNLRTQINQLDEQWKRIDFITNQYKDKDAYILDEIDDIFQALDESLATINTILGSRFVKPLRAEAESWKKNLFLLNQIVEEWVNCQKQWIYLENIFTAPDIKRQLPTESQRFDNVDKFFKQLMNKTAKSPNALKVVKMNPNLLDHLKNNNEILDDIQKKLEDYLEKKRSDFPRFYFLSNDELLEILANSQNLDVIQQHLRTCFDNIMKLDIQDGLDILAMKSSEGERVPFAKPPKVKGQVENWLDGVQQAMRDQLQKLMKGGNQDYNTMDRKEWVKTHFGQVVSAVAQIQWCNTTEYYINEMESNPNSLQECFEFNEQQLAQLTELIRGFLTNLQRKVIVALVTQDVHARDIVETLNREQVMTTNDFNWQQQLRYYWDEEIDDCRIKQVNASLRYGYEYMGATSRLVITPLTDRCWITITGALHIKLGAAPAGPAGTGKTESTKDLAKALGMQCIVFNCSDQVDYKMMARLFSGLAQQGAWACLDEFNRIDIEVLSVIAQQLLTIRVALMSNEPNFLFEGNQIPLIPTCGVFITMNPGYAGRTELPDNLKVLFRPVSMMIPDYGLIAEIMLFAEGFGQAKQLSKKMVKLYKLSSEQLSQQDHYDFGMRAVKSVLVMAGSLKRANPDMSEDATLIRAMIDSNVPKFLRDDLPLFSAIVQDLFPTVVIKDPDYGELQKQIEESLTTLNYQKVPEFILKTIQLFETFNVRFGVMIVGPTGAGKTTCYETLQHCMTTLREVKKSQDARFQIVKKKVLNPKAISMGELYGEVNPISQEWHDGLASGIMRDAAKEEGEDKMWVVFDGPVDAIWIENMNTVLDDNMTLCLANGQRIKLRLPMRMLFEVQDLAVASPATVSRCGMVYMTPEDLGWRPYVDSWIPRQFPNSDILDDKLKGYLRETFEFAIDMGLEKIRESLVEPIATVNIQLVINVCNFLGAIVTPQYGFKGKDSEKQKMLNQLFAWAYAWGMGGALVDVSKERFDDTVKDAFKGVQFPNAFTLYDYYFDAKRDQTYKPWSSKVPQFVYDKEVPYFQLLVPTSDTYRHQYLLEMLLQQEKCVFFTGITGVGKSSIVNSCLEKLADDYIVPININFSAQTSSIRTQQSIEDKLEKKRRTLFGAQPGKKIAIFVDDVNMPAVETYGAQPPIELLRMFVDKKGLFDRADWTWKDVEDSTVVCAAAPPGGGRNAITPRFVRHFHVFCLPTPSSGQLSTIFGQILGGFLKAGFQEVIYKMEETIISSTVEIYQNIEMALRPTPARFHYLFNLRDVSKVVQGILMTKPVSVQTPDIMARLWVNEMSRVFHDRLINDDDKEWFQDQIMDLLNRAFRCNFEKQEIFVTDKIMWGDLLKLDAPVKLYEQINDKVKLVKTISGMLDEYNIGGTNKMNLVFFEDAVEHILRIARILRQPRGNAMLIGVGGSGKQSLSRLASYMLELTYKQVEITKNFGPDQFKEFLKELMFSTGIDGEQITFVLTDTQIVNESFLEDINNLLNTGEVPNLMLPEDKDKIINGVRQVVIDMKKPDTIDIINATFIQRVRDFLHICLCMSPVGDTLRVRCRKFPSLVNCCTIDWFSRWPEEALLYVSSEFLKQLQLPSEEVRQSLAEMCMMVHRKVEEEAEQFYAELRRRVYTTPKSYLDLINLYLNSLETKRAEFNVNKNRLATGLKKLNDTNTNIAEMKVKLTELQPQLAKKNEELKIALEQVNKDKKIANEKEKVVSADAEVVNKQATEAKAIADDAQADLDAAKPELEAAQKSLESLDKNSIIEIKSFPNPPGAVVLVMEAVMILCGEKIDWANVRTVISNPSEFLDKLKKYDVSKTPEKWLERVRKNYLAKKEFDPEDVGRKSLAAKSMCQWVKALNNYSIVIKTVEPKKARYNEVKQILDKAQSELNAKLSEVKKVTDAVAKLEAECQAMMDEKAGLEAEMDRCEKRMGRAEKLVVLLADEGVRWKETVEVLEEEIEKLIGNVFLSCATISYSGGFTGAYRTKMNETWVTQCRERDIPTSEEFNMIKIMGDPVQIRGWNIAGLPTDSTSCENGIMATKAERWPLCIDPQQQANKWIKNMEKDNDLLIIKFSTPNFLRTLGNACAIGRPVLVEDIEEYLDPGIDPILLKQIFKADSGIMSIRIGDANLDYDDNFRFYITTKMPNPHYLPEVCIKVTLINFTVTFQGLEEQLLGDVVKQEKPEIEKQRDEIIVSMDNDQKTLKNIEITILKLLSESTEEQILDEDNLINVLEDSKKTSKEINERVAQSKIVEVDINNTRLQYKSVAVRGSILYFVIADLAGIDPMYQYSLGYVKKLFNASIEKSEKRETLEERLDLLIDNITRDFYTNVSRGIFEAHKTIYSFLITTSINRNSGKINDFVWSVLLRGAGLLDGEQSRVKPAVPDAKLLTQLGWDVIYYVECNYEAKFGGITQDIKNNLESWRTWATQDEPHNSPLPGEWQSKLDNFDRQALLKAFRPEKLMFSFTNYVEQELGRFFIESPAVTMEIIYKDTDVKTPLIFILSQGADPTSFLMKFSKDKGFQEKLLVISLGQGQGPKAEALINKAKKNGEWVMLQNCHLARSWMPRLELVVLDFAENEQAIHEDFRLYLTSMPADYFPVSVLQNGAKLTTEPPRGIRTNLKRSFQEINEETFEGCKKPEVFKKLVFGLCFFHAVMQERRKFGPLGWNIRYEFNDSDLETSQTMLRMFLDEQDDIPWDALIYVTGHINYGGRVTDDWDRVCLLSILKTYYNPEILNDTYRFSESGTYFAPTVGPIADFRQYIDELPMIENPEIFGLNENANITYQNQEARKIVDTILSIQPRISAAAGGKTPDEIVMELASELEANIPELLEQANGKKELFKVNKKGLIPSLSTVLLQEMQRFNRLITRITRSLKDLKEAIKGIIVMSQELDAMYVAMQNNQVPKNWEAVAYPSLKPLGSWYRDLQERVKVMEEWLQIGNPPSFWLSGFFFPQGFMTGVLQTHARKHKIAIDQLAFSFKVMEEEDPSEIEAAPDDGIYIYGLYMDGARWDRDEVCLADQFPGEMYSKMPMIWFIPKADYKPDPDEYSCPIYKTSVRAGVLSTTGQSTNFIVAAELPSKETPKYWTLKGTAMLCQLND